MCGFWRASGCEIYLGGLSESRMLLLLLLLLIAGAGVFEADIEF